MEHENLNIAEVMESRRHAVQKSLRPIDRSELELLADDLFPNADHPWLQKFIDVINDPASGTLYHATVDGRVHVLYCHDNNIGLWFIHGLGKGPLEPSHLQIMKGIVEARQ